MTEESPDPYSLLGIAPESSFEEVQVARQAKLDAVGDAPIPRARVEAAYDTILMDRLKERQQGRVSSAARSASQKETLPTPPRPLAKLQQLPSLPLPFSLATGRERLFPLISHGTLLVLVLVLPDSAPESLLALGALATLLNLLRRNGRFFQAVGCTLLLLALGLGLSIGLLAAVGYPSALALPIGPAQVQGAFALVVLLLGALFIA